MIRHARRFAVVPILAVLLSGCGGTAGPTTTPATSAAAPATTASATSAPATTAPATTGPLTTAQFEGLWPVGTTLAGATLQTRAVTAASPDTTTSMLDCVDSITIVARKKPRVSSQSADALVSVASTRYDDPAEAIDDVEQLAGICLGRQTARSGYDEPRWFSITAGTHGPTDQLLVVGYRNIVSMVYTPTAVAQATLVDAVVAQISHA